MNEVLEVIKRRRSIRKYLPDQIKDEELNTILEAAIFAPSGHNEQPWHFLVIQDKELIDRMSEKAKEAMTRSDIDWIVKIGQNTRR
ncbi:MAG TPA: nitroreductase family protein, partial [Thermosynergistes sp.]|nr:nitroreductase family protein [Thermosynergistes sp.]